MTAVWSWLKRNWYWVVLPVGILLVLWRLLRGERRGGVVVVHDPRASTDRAIETHDSALADREHAAEAHEEAEIKRIEAKHAATLEALSDAQRLRYDELKREGSKAATDWLLKVGRARSSSGE